MSNSTSNYAINPAVPVDISKSNKTSQVVNSPTITSTSTKRFCFGIVCWNIFLTSLLLLCIACLIVGALIPNIIWSAEKDQLTTRLPIDQNQWTDSQWSEFINTSTNADFYIFNVTNLVSVLTTGAKPNFVVVGPVKTLKYYTKTQLQYNADSSQLSYYEARNYVFNGLASSILDQTVIVINPLYLGAMAQVSRELAGIQSSTGLEPSNIQLNEKTFYLALITSQLIPELLDGLTNPSSTLLTALRFLSIPTYLSATIQTLTSPPYNISLTNILTAYSTPAPTPFPAPFDGFILPGPAGLTLAQAAKLFSSTSTFSMVDPHGILLWFSAVQGNSLALAAVSYNNGLSASDANVVLNWMRTLVFTNDYTFVVMAAALKTLTSLGLSQLAPSSFSDLALLQYATGLVVPLTTNNQFNSIVDLLGAQAGLLPTSTVAVAPELAIGANDFCSNYVTLVQCNNIRHAAYLSPNNAKLFLTTLSNNPQAYSVYINYFPLIFNDPNPLNKLIILQRTPIIGSYFNLSFIDPSASNVGQLYTYLHDYLPSILTGYPNQISSATGVAPNNGGLFIQSTVRQVLFPSSSISALGVPYHAVSLGDLMDLSSSTFQSYVDRYIQKHSNHPTIVHTGRDNIDLLGQYVQYEGSSSIVTACTADHFLADYPVNQTGCFTDPKNNNYPIWQTPEIISSTSDNLHSSPFHSKSDDVVSQYVIYITDLMRNVWFNYSGNEEEIKGIKLRQYYVDQRHLFTNYSGLTANTNPLKNDNYYTANAPDGLIHIFPVYGGVPLTASQPHFYQVDPIETNKMTGLSPNPSLHTSKIDIEPITGLTMSAYKRLQSSFRLDSTSLNAGYYSKLFTSTDHIYWPLYYEDEYSTINDDDASYFKDNVYHPIDASNQAQLAAIIAFPILIVIIIFIMVYINYYQYRNNSPPTNKSLSSGTSGISQMDLKPVGPTSSSLDLQLNKQNSLSVIE